MFSCYKFVILYDWLISIWTLFYFYTKDFKNSWQILFVGQLLLQVLHLFVYPLYTGLNCCQLASQLNGYTLETSTKLTLIAAVISFRAFLADKGSKTPNGLYEGIFTTFSTSFSLFSSPFRLRTWHHKVYNILLSSCLPFRVPFRLYLQQTRHSSQILWKETLIIELQNTVVTWHQTLPNRRHLDPPSLSEPLHSEFYSYLLYLITLLYVIPGFRYRTSSWVENVCELIVKIDVFRHCLKSFKR